jgi:hypothetical protein
VQFSGTILSHSMGNCEELVAPETSILHSEEVLPINDIDHEDLEDDDDELLLGDTSESEHDSGATKKKKRKKRASCESQVHIELIARMWSFCRTQTRLGPQPNPHSAPGVVRIF